MWKQVNQAFIGAIARSARRVVGAVLLTSASASGFAAVGDGYVTFNDGLLDGIFSQAVFGSTPIDIRFNATQTVVAPGLLSVGEDEFDGSELLSLESLRPPSMAVSIVAMFFVNDITFCGTAGTSIVGCGLRPGNLIAVQSAYAAQSRGSALLAHELGHNLGLDHVASPADNLMNPGIDGNTSLLADQVATIFKSPFLPGLALNPILQADSGGQYFISITPFAVVAAIPEPESWLMMGVGLIGVAGWARRRRAACAG